MVTLFQTFSKIIIIIALALFSFNGFAQSKQVKRVTSSQLMIYNGLVDFIPPEISFWGRATTPIIGFGGFYYIPNYRFFRSGMNINQYANTYLGVVSINGATPSIKGSRAEGTAYFIDGVRVYYLSETPMDYAGIIVKSAFGF